MKKIIILLGMLVITGLCFNWNAEEILQSKNLPKELEWFYFTHDVIVIPYLSGMPDAGFIIYYKHNDTYKIFHPTLEYKSDIITFSVCGSKGCLCGVYFAGGVGGDPEGGMKLYYITGKTLTELESKPQSFFMDINNFLTCLPNKICYLLEKIDNNTRRAWIIKNESLIDAGTYTTQERPYFTTWGDIAVFKKESNKTTVLWDGKEVGSVKSVLNVKNCYETKRQTIVCAVVKNYKDVDVYEITEQDIQEFRILTKQSPLIEKLLFVKIDENKTFLVYQNPVDDYYLVYKEGNKSVEERLPRKGKYYKFEANQGFFAAYAVEYQEGLGTTLWKVWTNITLRPNLVLIPRIIDIRTQAGEKTFIPLVIRNMGITTATNVTIKAQNFSYNLGKIKPLESINANIPVMFNLSGNYTVSISVSAKEPDMNPKDNEFDVIVYVSCVTSAHCGPKEYCKNGTCFSCSCEVKECLNKLGDKCKKQPQTLPTVEKQKEINWLIGITIGAIIGLLLAILFIKRRIKENH